MSIFDFRTLTEITLGRLRTHDEPRIRSSQDILLDSARTERELRIHQRLPW